MLESLQEKSKEVLEKNRLLAKFECLTKKKRSLKKEIIKIDKAVAEIKEKIKNRDN